MSANFSQTVLSASLAIGGTSLTVSTPSAPFAVPAAGAGRITLIDSAFAPTVMEIVTYTGRTDNGNGTFTYTGLTRGAEGTAAAAWSAGTVALQALTAGQYAADLAAKQATLVSGTNLKTLNGESLLGAGDLVIEGGGAGLTLFAESRSVASPNATVPVHALTAVGDEANIDFVIMPKGTGAILAQVPDGTAAGGNKRGSGAVDLQMSRTGATQVASGTRSVLMGYANAATGQDGVAIGVMNNASGRGGIAIGNACVASNNYALAMGNSSQATQSYSTAFGQCSFARTEGAIAEACSNSLGRYQTQRIFLRIDTTSTDPALLTATGSSANTYNHVVLPNNSAYYCRIRVLARNTSTNGSMSWSGTALIKRGANSASTTLIGSTIASDFGDAAMSACTVTLSADTTRGSLAVMVTGLAATTIRWVAQVETVEAA